MEQERFQGPLGEEPKFPEQSSGKPQWQEPKLTYVKPKLSKHGDLKEVTAGFFQVFTV